MGKAAAAVLLVGVLVSSGVAWGQSGELILASTSDEGAKGDRRSLNASLSAEGTRVAFASGATNLHPDDTDVVFDVYVKDLLTGEIILASASAGGLKGNRGSFVPSLSGDGTKVAFASGATNLHPDDTDAFSDVYVKDLVTGEVILASATAGGVTGNGQSGRFAHRGFSADGTRVVFHSSATNLHPDDTDAFSDVYVKDLVTGELILASATAGGVTGNDTSFDGDLSSDGTKVVFASAATNLHPDDTDAFPDVYVKDLVTGDLTLASTSATGVKANGLSGFGGALSADGTKVAFVSRATNLHPADTGTDVDVYLKDLSTGEVILVSTSDGGIKGNGDSRADLSLSDDGTRVAFASEATNLDAADPDALRDLYVKDLVTGDLILASTSGEEIKGNGSSIIPSLSANGTRVSFESLATNLHPGDTDGLEDVYVKSLPENLIEGEFADAVALVRNMGLPDGLTNSLASKLQAASDAVDSGDLNEACRILGAFLNEVNAQSGKKLTTEQAELLTAAANDIRTLLECT